MTEHSIPNHADYSNPESVLHEREALDGLRANHGSLTLDDLERISNELGLDILDVTRCLRS